MVFDAPKINAPFSIRYERIKEAIETSKNPNLLYVPHIICEGKDHLLIELDKI
jgi:DNA ligase-1